MRTDQAVQCRSEGELAALMARKQSSGDEHSRCALFNALSDLERRALVGGASDLTLRKIAESRFLAGILREAVRPFPLAPLRAVLRVRQRVDARSSGRAPTEADPGFV
ncbi:hypothetical protein ACRAWG_22345 [Methylobacterium sp. P31]